MCLCNETNKNPGHCGFGTFWLVNIPIYQEYGASWLHWATSSCAWDPYRSCSIYLFIWLFICIPHNKSITVSIVLCSVLWLAIMETKGVVQSHKFVVSQAEVGVDWGTHLWLASKIKIFSMANLFFNLWNLVLTVGSYYQKWVELQNTQSVLEPWYWNKISMKNLE